MKQDEKTPSRLRQMLDQTVEISFGAVLLVSFLWCAYGGIEYMLVRQHYSMLAFLIVTPIATFAMAIVAWVCLKALAWIGRRISVTARGISRGEY